MSTIMTPKTPFRMLCWITLGSSLFQLFFEIQQVCCVTIRDGYLNQSAFAEFKFRASANSHHRMLMPHGIPGLPERAINSEPFYQKWPDSQRIPFMLDDSYCKSVLVEVVKDRAKS